jgi:hypothetical protein
MQRTQRTGGQLRLRVLLAGQSAGELVFDGLCRVFTLATPITARNATESISPGIEADDLIDARKVEDGFTLASQRDLEARAKGRTHCRQLISYRVGTRRL